MVARLSKFLATSLLAATGVKAAQNQLQQVTGNIGPNPNNVPMFVYKPTKLASPLPLIVAIHYCTGTAQAYFAGTQYANLADTYGFLVVYPTAPRDGTCFDVNTNATLTHNGGGDSQGIASMITYSIATYGVSPNHVYVTGTSSGAMMTNVMAGSYPDLIQATSIYSGVPFACFAGADAWSVACATGQIIQTPAQWGDLVRAAYPGYTGPRPKMMIWHGTVDTALYYQNFLEEVKQWTNVLGDSQTPRVNVTNDPESGYTMTTYGPSAAAPNVIAYSAAGVGHTVPVHETIDLEWFGITSGNPGAPPASSAPAPTSSTPATTSSAPASTTTAAGTVAHYDQCGGIGYAGTTVCQSPYTCQVANAYYSQCL